MVSTSLYVEGHEVKAVARPVLEQVVLDLTGEESVHLGQNASLSSVATLLIKQQQPPPLLFDSFCNQVNCSNNDNELLIAFI